MTLFKCSAIGVSPSGRQWSFGIHFSSGGTAASVEVDWLAQIDSMWLNGSHGIETLFPVATVLETTRTAQLAVVTVGALQKIRETAVTTDNPALPGTSVNASMPDQNTILVSLRTGLPGREKRGRIHLPAPDVTLVTNSQLGSVPATRVSTALNALLVGMAGAGHQPILLVTSVTKIGTAVGTTTNITTAETDRVIRTVRARNKREKAVYI